MWPPNHCTMFTFGFVAVTPCCNERHSARTGDRDRRRTVSVPLRVATASNSYTATSLLLHASSPSRAASAADPLQREGLHHTLTIGTDADKRHDDVCSSLVRCRDNQTCSSPRAYSSGVSSNASTSRTPVRILEGGDGIGSSD